ncbi:MAG: NTP transferase domain-containing protein, partial [Gammaproteobacteria bacterium]|nr:NTP transferase domain-containing protein [Gammaproteobacteria bacterium]
MDEALKRASAYCEAGADAILIHSRQSRADEILAFAGAWDGSCPLVIVPTKYYSTPVDVFRKAGVSLVIWANQMIRASVRAMENTSREIFEQQSLVDVEDIITEVDNIFRLQGADELLRAQERYLNSAGECRALVLAASRGNNLYELTEDRPKAMLNIRGKPLLQRLVDEFKKRSVNDITVIAGYKSEALDLNGIDMRLNTRYESTGELYSLACARDKFSDDMVIIYGDLLFRSYILQDLLEHDGEIVIVVDSLINETEITGAPDYVWCDRPDDRSMFMQDVRLQRVGEEKLPDDPPSGRWTGMMRTRSRGRLWLEQALDELEALSGFDKLTLPDLLNHLTRSSRPVTVHYINGHWLDVNSVNDIDRAGDFTSD